MFGSGRTITRVWPDEPAVREHIDRARDDLVGEARVDDTTFRQHRGPFRDYERVLSSDGTELTERTTYRLQIPWFGWLFALPVRAVLSRRGYDPVRHRPHVTP